MGRTSPPIPGWATVAALLVAMSLMPVVQAQTTKTPMCLAPVGTDGTGECSINFEATGNVSVDQTRMWIHDLVGVADRVTVTWLDNASNVFWEITCQHVAGVHVLDGHASARLPAAQEWPGGSPPVDAMPSNCQGIEAPDYAGGEQTLVVSVEADPSLVDGVHGGFEFTET